MEERIVRNPVNCRYETVCEEPLRFEYEGEKKRKSKRQEDIDARTYAKWVEQTASRWYPESGRFMRTQAEPIGIAEDYEYITMPSGLDIFQSTDAIMRAPQEAVATCCAERTSK